jgi:Transposase IS66 family
MTGPVCSIEDRSRDNKKQMAAPRLQEPAKKALATLDREWDRLTAHRDYPMISLDSNAAERMIHGPVVTRKTPAAPATRTPPGSPPSSGPSPRPPRWQA